MKLMPKSLAFRLIVPLTILVAVVSAGFGLVNVRVQKHQLIDEMVIGVDQLSRSIIAATWEAMMRDERESAYKVMRSIGQRQGVDSIRFFNKEGQVTFSTDPDSAAQVDKNAEACFLCHAKEQPLVRVDRPNRAREFVGKDGSRKMGMVSPIYNEPSCSEAPCHAHPPESNVLGVLDIVTDISHVDREVAGIQQRTFWMTLIQVVLIGALIFVYTRHSVTRPIRRLIRATRAVSEMDLDHELDVGTSGEIAELAESFDKMRRKLKAAIEEINDFTYRLEQKVERSDRRLGAAQQKLIQGDRMASLGQLAASVAHEINNPVQGVLNFSMLMQRLVDEGGIPPDRVGDFRRYLKIVSDETARVGRIVSDLLSFSRRSKPQSSEEDFNAIVEQTVSLLTHQLELQGVGLELELDPDLEPIQCDKSQIQQVVVNLVMNAAEAMQAGGEVRVRSSAAEEGDAVRLEVIDSGVGIPEEMKSRVFDPFISTKEEGKGVGLGLAVVYGIVDSHGGVIDFESRVGEGTVFTVTLPRQSRAHRRDDREPPPDPSAAESGR
ncbi:MAG: ATP-binding protein [Polyangia bacterium]